MEKQTENKKKTGNKKATDAKKMETTPTEASVGVKMALSVSAEADTIREIFPENVLLAMASTKTASSRFSVAVDSLEAIQKHAAKSGIRVDWSGNGGRLRFDKIDANGRPTGRLGRISSQGGILLLKGSSRIAVKVGLVPQAQ